MRIILLIMIGLSFLKADFIRDNTTSIVTDTFTNLQWQDDANVTTSTRIWKDAIDYCETLNLGGHNDWHLPSKNELLSIVDNSIYNPAISSIFQNTNSSYYWSSTTVVSAITAAWGVDFSYGDGHWLTLTNDTYVRCVR